MTTNINNIDVAPANATLPPSLTFTNHSLTVVIIYCMCFIIAAVGNLTVFVTLSRGRYRKSRISLMICHLSAADLVVTFIMIPVEVSWRLTVQWVAGNIACKVFSFLRAFGLYLSSNILVCVSLDRYFAVLHPLRVTDAKRRGKIMLTIAWISSVIYATPQYFIFHVSTHPEFPNFHQCVTFESLDKKSENLYAIFCVLAMYFIPLIIICWAYTKILCEITSKSRGLDQVIPKSNSSNTCDSTGTSTTGSRMRLRRSDMSCIERARSRTLKMTITIVAVFILCWTPYVGMLLWYTIDRPSAEKVDSRIQEFLFLMAVSNSCANPLVYGSYAIDFRKECCRCFLPYPTASSSRRMEGAYELANRNANGGMIRVKKNPGVSSVICAVIPDILKGKDSKSTQYSGTALLPMNSDRQRISESLSSKKSLTVV
ncbi:gonadotropin-releasing hormone II receptor-like isoform X1 [Aphidius gifuensis]|nr:gonadotropin-releasing hormone II receptor-like isoform X1 [Aphidius gifuensis]